MDTIAFGGGVRKVCWLAGYVQEKLQHDPDTVTTNAAQPVPDRKPYTSKPTVQDKAFHKELEQMRVDAEAGVIHTPKREPEDGGAPSLKLDDYPDLCKRPAKSPS